VKLWKFGANSCGAIEKFSRVGAVSSKVCYADSSRCNKPSLSAVLMARQTLFVSFLKQQLLPTAEVHLQAFAIPFELIPATVPRKGRAKAPAPRVTESRRERRHPAGQPCRHHESRAPRRAGSQG
jgi:hypothetical protein